MRRPKLLSAILVAAVVAAAPAPAQTTRPKAAPQTTKKPRNVTIAFQQFKLKNGLRVILSEDHTAPTCSIAVVYNVGSSNERPGRTGFAHLFEHMMFEGSENVADGEHSDLIALNGGEDNGTTDQDRTLYYESLPANQLDLGLYLEADRMRSLNVSKDNLDTQRNAVQEERRLRIDNQPFGRTSELVDETAYDNFAYKHSVIGSIEDLNASSLEDVKEFFRIYYAPNNAVLAVVGDFETRAALAKIKKHFEGIPAQPAPPRVDLAEPTQPAERRQTLEDDFARTPRLDIVFKIPRGFSPDWFALDLAGDVLVRGRSSRLYQKLVREKQVAVNVFGGPDARRGVSLFYFIVNLQPSADPAEVEKLIYQEIGRVQTESVSEAELRKIAMQNRRSRAQSLTSSLSRAIQLAEFAASHKDPGLINTLLDKYARVAPADVQRVARTYWKETNRTVLLTVPKARPAGPAN